MDHIINDFIEPRPSGTAITAIIEVDPAMDTLPEIQQAMTEALGNLLDIDDLAFPCHLAIIAANGWG